MRRALLLCALLALVAAAASASQGAYEDENDSAVIMRRLLALADPPPPENRVASPSMEKTGRSLMGSVPTKVEGPLSTATSRYFNSKYLIGLATAIAYFVGPALIFMVLPILVGPCFYCCRKCCNTCGKWNSTKPLGYSVKERLIPHFCGLFLAVLLFSFVAIGLTQNTGVHQAIGDLFDAVIILVNAVVNLGVGLVSTAAGAVAGIPAQLAALNQVGSANGLDTLGTTLPAQFNPLVDQMVGNTTRVEVAKQVLVSQVSPAHAENGAAVNNTMWLISTLDQLTAELNAIKTYTVNNTAYTTVAPDATGASNGIYDFPLGNMLDDMYLSVLGLPNFTAQGVSIRQQWNNASANIGQQATDANMQLYSSVNNATNDMSKVLDSVKDQLDQLTAQVNDYETQGTNYRDIALAYDTYRQILFAVPMYITLVAVLLGTVGVLLALFAKKRVGPLFTCMSVLSFLMLTLIWLNFIIYFLLAVVLDLGCNIVHLAVADFTQPSNGDIIGDVFGECSKPNGNLFNTKALNLTKMANDGGLNDIPHNVYNALDKALTTDGILNADDLATGLSNATHINATGYTDACVTTGLTIPFDLATLNTNLNSATNQVNLTFFHWDPTNVYTKLHDLNAATSQDGVTFSLANYTTFDHSYLWTDMNAEDLWDILDNAVQINATVYQSIADYNGGIAKAKAHVALAMQLQNIIRDNSSHACNDTKPLPADYADFYDVAQDAAAATAKVQQGIGARLAAVKFGIAAAVGNTFKTIGDNLVAALFGAGGCNKVITSFNGIDTALCSSFQGSLIVMFMVALLVGILLCPNIICGTLNAKRAVRPDTQTAVGYKTDERDDSSAGPSDDDSSASSAKNGPGAPRGASFNGAGSNQSGEPYGPALDSYGTPPPSYSEKDVAMVVIAAPPAENRESMYGNPANGGSSSYIVESNSNAGFGRMDGAGEEEEAPAQAPMSIPGQIQIMAITMVDNVKEVGRDAMGMFRRNDSRDS